MKPYEHDPNLIVGCPECGAGMRREGSYVLCNGCSYTEGAVSYADRAAAFRRQHGPAVRPGKPVRKGGKRQRKADRVRQRLAQPDLFGNVVKPGSAYRDAEAKAARNNPKPIAPVIVIDKGNGLCPDCERVLQAKYGRLVCVACGQEYGPADAVQMISRIFSTKESK